jgi:hypothetical protein
MSHNRDLSAAAAQFGFHSSNIGIGSEAPRYALDVYNSNLLVSGPSAGNIILEDRSVGDSSRPFHVVSSDGGKFVINRSNRNASGTTTSSVNSLTLSSSGNLGLGPQTNPTSNIHIADLSANGYELKISGNALQFNRTSNSYIDQLNDTGSILFRMTSSNTEAMRITSGGNIGINDSGPNFHLDVDGNIGVREGQVITWHDGSGNKAGDIYMDSSDNFVIRNTSSVAERLRIDSSGRIGINQTSPNAPLSFNTGIGQKIELYNSGSSNEFGLGVENGEFRISCGTASFIAFRTGGYNGAERVRIDAGGALLVNAAIDNAGGHGRIVAHAPTSGNTIYKAIEIGNTSADGTGRGGAICGQPKSNSHLPYTLIGSWDHGDNTDVYYGGGWGGAMRPATRHRFYTNSSYPTTGGSGTQTMTLDSDGYLTLSNQPVFQATGQPSHRYMNSWNSVDLPNWNYLTQNGSHFNNSTGRFTAPVAGKYYFIFTAMYTNPSTNDVATYVIKNGTTEVLSNNHSGGGNSNGHQWNDITVHAIVNMAANDWVSARMVGNSSATCYFYGASGSKYGSFSGFLIG